MDIYTVKANLKRTIEGKEKYLKSWKDADIIETAEKIHRATVVGMLEANITELKNILADVEACCSKASDDSWINNPDRMGGSFTAEELDPNRGWK